MKPTYTFELKRSRNGEHYWRLLHRNGKEIARSSETYKRPATCKRALDRLLRAMKGDGFYSLRVE